MNARPLNNRLNETGFTQVGLFVLVTIIGALVAFALPHIDLSIFETKTAMMGAGSTLMTAQHDVLVTFGRGSALEHSNGHALSARSEGPVVRHEGSGDNLTMNHE